MKKSGLFLNCVLLAALAAGCNDDKTDDRQLPPQTDPHLTIRITDIGTESATVQIAAQSKEIPYFWQVLPQQEFADEYGSDAAAYIDAVIRERMSQSGKEIAEVVESIRTKGDVNTTVSNLTPQTRYIVFAAGLDAEGKTTTDPTEETFSTEALADTGYEIGVSEITDHSALVGVDPKDPKASYYVNVIDSKTLARYQDGPAGYVAELIAGMVEESGKSTEEVVASIVTVGDFSRTFESLEAETEYTAFAIGIEADGTPKNDGAAETFTTDTSLPAFTIDLTELTGSSVVMTVTPRSQENSYFYDVLPAASFETYHDNDAATYLANFVQDKREKGASVENIFSVIATTGTDSHPFSQLTPSTDYVALAIGINSDCTPATAGVVARFKTEEVVSDNTYRVEFSNPDFDGIDFTVTPENDDTYFYMWKPKAYCDTMTDQEIIDVLFAEYGFLIDYLYTYSGETTYENEHVMSTDTGYYVLIFGYENGVNTTPLYKFPFRTNPSQTDPAQCTFRVETTEVTSSSATVSITPSDEQVMYMWDLIDGETYRQQINSMGTYVTEYVALDLENLEYNRVRGTDGLPFNRTLTPDTEYYVWTAAIDEFGKPVGEVKMSDPFRTLPREVSSASVTADFVKYFDGDELYKLSTTDYGDCRGKAYVYVNFHQSADAALWYGQMFDEDLSNPEDPTDTEIITTLVDNNGGLWCPVGKPFLCEWDKPHTILAVALGRDDNYGPVFRSRHTFTKAGAAPASEIGDVMPQNRSAALKASGRLTHGEYTPVVQRFKPARPKK